MTTDVCSRPEEHGGSAVAAEYREEPHPARRREKTLLCWIYLLGAGASCLLLNAVSRAVKRLLGLRSRPRSGSPRRTPSGQSGQLTQVSPAEVELAEETNDLRLGYPEDLRPRQRQARQRQDHDARLKLPGNRAADDVDHRLVHDQGLRLARGTDKTAGAASGAQRSCGDTSMTTNDNETLSGRLPDPSRRRDHKRDPASPNSHHS
jgi:hypothetical protein